MTRWAVTHIDSSILKSLKSAGIVDLSCINHTRLCVILIIVILPTQAAKLAATFFIGPFKPKAY
jgi:hypothetical protein